MLSTTKKFIKIIGKNNLNLSFLIAIGSLVSALFEVASIGSIIPLLTIVFSGDFEKFVFLSDFIDNKNQTIILTFLMIFITSIFLLKTIYQILFNYLLGLFTSKVYFDISTNLFLKYMRREYLHHIQENSANKVQLVNNESNMAVQGYLKPFLTLFTETLTVGAIALLLFFYDPRSFLVLLSFLIFVFVVATISTKNILTRLGTKRTELEIQKLKDVQQSLFGFKFIKLSNSISHSKNLFVHSNKKIASIRAKEFFYKQSVRPVLELTVLLGIFALSIFLFIFGSNKSDILIIVSLYLTASLRILPSLSRMIGAVQSISFFSNVIVRLYEAFAEITISQSAETYKRENIEPAYISFENVSFRFNEGERNIFEKLNAKFEKNTFIGLIGKSGSGKSTFINILIGLIEPHSGSVFHYENNIFNMKKKWHSKIGYVPQDVYLIDDSIKKNIAFGIPDEEIVDSKVFDAAERANLTQFLNDLPDGIDTIIGENATKISGGQKQRLAIARALYNDPEILVFDEATNALDENTEDEIINEILAHRDNKTIFFSTHKPSTLLHADRVVTFKNNTIIDLKSW